jgi:hypothetical protein
MIHDAFRLGGWGMIPTLVAGLMLVGASVGFAIAPDARRAALVRALVWLTLSCAGLGFVAGLIKTCTSCGEALDVVVRGFGESLNNIGLGLAMVVVAGIGSAVGVYRRAQAGDDVHGV